ncbi:MAG TPA: hypothetical protein VKA12_13465 [Roseiarcus sp.]|nr:hypothetical protein [Roseiarcus sp.]
MTVYKNATCDTYHAEGVEKNLPVEVRISGGSVAVSYEDDDGRPAVYEGNEIAPGHYELRKSNGNGTATLHLTPGGSVLEGSWIEDGYAGMWQIDIAE